MRVYFSGGSPLPESYIRKPSPDVMLSFFVDAGVKKTKNKKTGKWKVKAANCKPYSRLRKCMEIRKKAKRNKNGKPD
jgi:hypothetical protein